MTTSYLRLLQETDFWLTDEHDDDNTQQGLMDIADGVAILERYSADVHRLVDQMRAAPREEKKKYGERAIAASQAYDRNLDRLQIMIESAVSDMERRLRTARLLPQLARVLRSLPKGTNPPALPPVDYELIDPEEAERA
jgi:DNA invertase Pin-like site-specific DNA recombinase